MKKMFSICLAFVFLLVLAACSGGPSPASGAYGDGYYETYEPEADWRNVEMDSQEVYDTEGESPFKDVATSPLSTFSADVDTASYSNMRRFINNGQRPQGVRIEELVNYFGYDYETPGMDSEHPFSITAEVAPCPWNGDNLLAMVAIQGAELEYSGDIANNIVFLIDVSGSMEDANKLPLLRESFKLLIEKLGENDVISIVTYAGSNKVIADGVRGNEHRKLARLMDTLSAGGSTAGANGIRTAYELAEKHFIEDGNNRVILATDGDFNVGESTTDQLKALIEQEREKGVFISVLGFGMYNLNDAMMETIADSGNGNYAYIDTIEEAKKVLVDEFDSTMFVIAQDLKIQVEFNPGTVAQYRLIGYDNRRLENEDFNDDKKDAGDVGAGHSVTAFYELVPAGEEGPASVDELRYQTSETTGSNDFMTVMVRYKQPGEEESRLTEHVVGVSAYSETMSENFAFASAVAEFGLILTDSNYRSAASLGAVIGRADRNLGEDAYGLRAEFVELVRAYKGIVD